MGNNGTRGMRPRAVTIAVVLTLGAVLISGCSAPPGEPEAAATTEAAAPTAPASTPALTARLTLPSTSLDVGAAMRGEVIVENGSAESSWVRTCVNLYAAYLENETFRQEIVWPTCGEGLEIPVGESRWPIEIVTLSGDGCIVPATTSKTSWSCPLAGSPMPPGTPTPAGLYRVSVMSLGDAELPVPEALTIEVRDTGH